MISPILPSLYYRGVTFICVPVGTIINEDTLGWVTSRSQEVTEDNFIFKGPDCYCAGKAFRLLRAKLEEATKP